MRMRIISRGLQTGLDYDTIMLIMSPGDITQIWLDKVAQGR